MSTTTETTTTTLTELAFVLDRSGSMCGLESDTIGGFNSVIAENKKAAGDCFVTTVLFDDRIETLHDRIDINELAPMTTDDYKVRGCTALLDAIGDTVKRIEKIHRYQPKGFVPDKTIVVVFTDGYENASTRYTYGDIKRLIAAKEELGWEFLFLAANIDVAKEAANLGFAQDRVVEYLTDAKGCEVAYDAVACASVQMRACPTGRIGGAWSDSVKKDTKARGKRH